VYNKDTVGYSCEQRWFNLFVDIQAQQDAPTQDKGVYYYIITIITTTTSSGMISISHLPHRGIIPTCKKNPKLQPYSDDVPSIHFQNFPSVFQYCEDINFTTGLLQYILNCDRVKGHQPGDI
jgi:hypothetical protein